MPYYALCVESSAVKTVKSACESSNILSSSNKIYKDGDTPSGQTFVVPTSIYCQDTVTSPSQQSTVTYNDLPQELELLLGELRSDGVPFELRTIQCQPNGSNANRRVLSSPLQAALKQAFDKVARKYEPCFADWHNLVPDSFPKSYCIYSPMLLLPSTWYSNAICKGFLHKLTCQGALEVFFSEICNMLGVSHVAVNAAIPSSVESEEENIIRSPTDFNPIYGDFGALLAPFPKHSPSTDDFHDAFWVSIRQNGIHQIWAPRYTMFSAGNVTEKIRIAKLLSVQRAVDDGIKSGLGCSAVDLFAGIGYFAFSYAKAGVSKVLCWDLNPWSVEGFRRGANRNHWKVRLVDANDTASTESQCQHEPKDATCRFIVFQESNVHARKRIANMREMVPPIRHVNCGMLPTVGQAWITAVEAIDPILGGWIHIHETVHENKLNGRTHEIISGINEHLGRLCTSGTLRQAELIHVEKVKSMGPRLSHIVLDVWIPSRADGP